MFRITILYTDGVQTVHHSPDWLWGIAKHLDHDKAVEKITVFRLLMADPNQLPLLYKK